MKDARNIRRINWAVVAPAKPFNNVFFTSQPVISDHCRSAERPFANLISSRREPYKFIVCDWPRRISVRRTTPSCRMDSSKDNFWFVTLSDVSADALASVRFFSQSVIKSISSTWRNASKWEPTEGAAIFQFVLTGKPHPV